MQYRFTFPPYAKLVKAGCKDPEDPVDIIHHAAGQASARIAREGWLGRPTWVVECANKDSVTIFNMAAADVFEKYPPKGR